MAPDPYRYFRLEARELLDRFASGVAELERGAGSAALVQQLLRHAHTLKGAARVVRQEEIADRAHAIEDALAPLRDGGGAAVPREAIEAILRCLDDIGRRLPALAVPAPAVAALAVATLAVAEGTEPSPAVAEDIPTIRADVDDIDALLDGVAEVQALLSGLRQSARSVERAERLSDLLLAQLARQPHGHGERVGTMAEDLWRSVSGLERTLGSAVDLIERELQQLRDDAEQLRLIPATTLLTALGRIARDAAQGLRKQVTFAATGGDIRLDAHVLGGVQAALVQIVRNAVAHGIEPAPTRLASGKPAAGRVTVTVARRAGRIVFTCADDGRGVDLEAVRATAVRRGVAGAEAAALDAGELVRLLLRGGISTAETVTKAAGRGVGLDIVRESLARLGGEVAVRSDAGAGTTFELTVPPALAALTTLAVESGGRTLMIALDSVQGSLRIAPQAISRTAAGASIVHGHEAIPFLPLSQALDGAAPPAGRAWSAVVLAGEGGKAAIGVDRLLGIQRTVVRPLPGEVAASALVAGAALDAEGNPQLVLDAASLVAAAQRGEVGGAPETAPRRPVLVVDDSLTTRMLEQSILESAGYEVDAAVSGEEGLERARRKRYALFLVDVEMPGMDGFTFVERARADPSLHDIPAILVTSRSAAEDLQRGRDAGANGYVVKGEFDQTRLLSMISDLMAA